MTIFFHSKIRIPNPKFWREHIRSIPKTARYFEPPSLARIGHGITGQKEEESPRFRHPMPDDHWREVFGSMNSVLSGLEQEKIQSLAGFVAEAILWLDVSMTKYCELTCPSCQDPCCTGRKVFFNQADILYLIARDGDIPPGQTRTQASEPCRYLGQNGCRIPRTSRPYVCVWFICDPQMSIFQEEPAMFQRQFIKVLKDIRTCRLMLESLYEQHMPIA